MLFSGTTRVNEGGRLEIGGCDAVELAHRFGTPLYVLDEECFRAACREYHEVFSRRGGVAVYAGKSLLTLAVCRLVEEEHLGLDVVSGGELHTAMEAGFPMSRVYFHGNNKSAAELQMGLAAGIHCFVVDNFEELDRLAGLARRAGTRANILLRLTPGIEAHTHDYIRTGQVDSKFGFVIPNGQAREAAQAALSRADLNLIGLHCHLGSQIFDLQPFADAAGVMLRFAREIKEASGWECKELNLGGGLGIYYAEGDDPPSKTDLAETVLGSVRHTAHSLGLEMPKVLVEPGRSISGPAGTTLYTIGSVKTIPGVRTYVAVDGGMSDNLRPALYGAEYEACLAGRPHDTASTTVTVAGRHCESGDILIRDLKLPLPRIGEILAVGATGAYNYAMAMNYNRFPRPAMVLVRDGAADVIVRRETYADIINQDQIPARLRKRRTETALV